MITLPGTLEQDLVEIICEKAKYFMQHPSITNWADKIALQWIEENPDRLEKQHHDEFKKLTAEKNGEELEKLITEFQELYNHTPSLYKKKDRIPERKNRFIFICYKEHKT